MAAGTTCGMLTPMQQAQVRAFLRGESVAPAPEDCPVLIAYLRERSLVPWLYASLREQGALASWPAAAQAELAAWWLAAQARQQRLAAGLQLWLQALAVAGIPVIPLKGACLAWSVYPQPTQRPMVDLDLLVPFAALDKAWAVGLHLGYQPQTPRYAQDSVKHQLPALLSPCQQVSIELHWRIGLVEAPFPIPLESLWEGTRAVTLAGQAARCLGLERQLLHLVLNLAHQDQLSHRNTLLQLLDIAVLLKRFGAELDWLKLWREARRWRLTHGLYLTLYLAQQVWAAPVPNAVLADECPVDWNELWGEQLTAQVLWGERWRYKLPLEPYVHDTLAPLASLAWHQRVPWLRRKLLLSRAELAERYPGVPYPLAQAWRWIRLPMRMFGRLLVWVRRRATVAGQRHQHWVETSRALRAWLEAESGGKE